MEAQVISSYMSNFLEYVVFERRPFGPSSIRDHEKFPSVNTSQQFFAFLLQGCKNQVSRQKCHIT